MTFSPGDRVHLAGLGTGVIRAPRGSGRYAVEIKGRIVIASAGDLEVADSPGRTHHRLGPERALASQPAPERTLPALDLHGKTVVEAIAVVEVWMNDALLEGHREARVIHGRGGGRLKGAVHQYLRGLSAVASFRVDPRNPGVTIVTFA